jgi:hypothetical protein
VEPRKEERKQERRMDVYKYERRQSDVVVGGIQKGRRIKSLRLMEGHQNLEAFNVRNVSLKLSCILE